MSRASQIRESRRAVSGEKSAGQSVVQPVYHRNSGLVNGARRAPVAVHGYDPVREIACQAVGMAYGQVYVGGCGESVRSYEINTAGDDSGFLPESQVRGERMGRVCG